MAIAKVPLFFFILIIFSSSDKLIIVESFNHIGYFPSVVAIPGFLRPKVKDIHDKNVENQLHFGHKVVTIKARKLLEAEVVQLDYDYAGPNPKHDPRKGRGGRSL